MYRNQSCLILMMCLLSLCLVDGLYGFTAGTDTDLVGWWKLDEGSGSKAYDSSGYDNDGSVEGDREWVTGILGGALFFNGTDTYIDCGNDSSLQITSQITLAAWLKTDGFTKNWASIVGKGDNAWRLSRSSETGNSIHFGIGGATTSGDPWFDASKSVTDDEWHHVAGVYDGTLAQIYIDGIVQATLEATGSMSDVDDDVYIGENSGATNRYLSGTLDDVRIYKKALSQDEILIVMEGDTGPLATEPIPDDEDEEVSQYIDLAWTAGPYAQTHDVYLSTDFVDVNTADRDTPNDALISQGQSEATYTPAEPLTFGQTYYWRVDEVNGSPDYTIYQGDVWSFTVEPYAYPVQPILATASNSSTFSMGPEKTIDGSGLDDDDLHGTASTHMWLSKSTPVPTWIQYEFDQAYKLHEMWVWNSNQSLESYVGYGARDVTIEFSVDGTTWTPLGDVIEFARAPGKAGYAHNTTVDLGNTWARYVRLTIDQSWGGKANAGLSEVRFFYTPLEAFGPTPENGAVDVDLDTTLTWHAGREAAEHQLYISTNADEVAYGTVTPEILTIPQYALSNLEPEYGRTYTWLIDEVNEAADPNWVQGSPWTFTTIGYAVVDDFESYDDLCNWIYGTWIDGIGHSGSDYCDIDPVNGNGTGATVGNWDAPFAEQTIVYAGGQSMPLAFDNTSKPYLSEGQREWSSAQSWTTGGLNTLSLQIYGNAENSPETLYVGLEDRSGTLKTISHSDDEIITREAWEQWDIPLSDFSSAGVDLDNVKVMIIGIGNPSSPSAGGEGSLYIDDIRLLRLDD